MTPEVIRKLEWVEKMANETDVMKAKIKSLNEADAAKDKYIKELETRVADCDEHVRRTSSMEHELKTAVALKAELSDLNETLQADLREAQNAKFELETAKAEIEGEMKTLEGKMKALEADANKCIDQSQTLVNRLEACVFNHMKTCPTMKAEVDDYMDRDEAAFLPGTYVADVPAESEEEESLPEPQEQTETIVLDVDNAPTNPAVAVPENPADPVQEPPLPEA